MLPRHARCVLSCLRCNGHSILLGSFQDWQNRESFCSAWGHLPPGHLLSHSALSSYVILAPLALWRLSISLRPQIQALGSCPAFGAPWSSAMPHPSKLKQQLKFARNFCSCHSGGNLPNIPLLRRSDISHAHAGLRQRIKFIYMY